MREKVKIRRLELRFENQAKKEKIAILLFSPHLFLLKIISAFSDWMILL